MQELTDSDKCVRPWTRGPSVGTQLMQMGVLDGVNWQRADKPPVKSKVTSRLIRNHYFNFCLLQLFNLSE